MSRTNIFRSRVKQEQKYSTDIWDCLEDPIKFSILNILINGKETARSRSSLSRMRLHFLNMEYVTKELLNPTLCAGKLIFGKIKVVFHVNLVTCPQCLSLISTRKTPDIDPDILSDKLIELAVYDHLNMSREFGTQ